MPSQPLTRSYKRKYKKMHGRFTSIQSSTNMLQDELNAVTETALRITADNDMLLDMLAELGPRHNLPSVQEQLSFDYGNTGLNKKYYDQGIPEHFKSVPWNLDLQSYSGSHLEDLAKVAAVMPQNVPVPMPEIAANITSSRKIARIPVMKKRGREGEDDPNSVASKKKKKRKSMLDQSNTTWSP